MWMEYLVKHNKNETPTLFSTVFLFLSVSRLKPSALTCLQHKSKTLFLFKPSSDYSQASSRQHLLRNFSDKNISIYYLKEYDNLSTHVAKEAEASSKTTQAIISMIYQLPLPPTPKKHTQEIQTKIVTSFFPNSGYGCAQLQNNMNYK